MADTFFRSYYVHPVKLQGEIYHVALMHVRFVAVTAHAPSAAFASRLSTTLYAAAKAIHRQDEAALHEMLLDQDVSDLLVQIAHRLQNPSKAGE